MNIFTNNHIFQMATKNGTILFLGDEYLRICKFCNIEKNIDEFHSFMNKNGYLNYRRECKDCRNSRRRVTKTYSIERGRALHLNWRKSVLEKDEYKCIKCDSQSKLVVHHIKEWHTHPELRFEISNGETLCSKCHNIHHGNEKKGKTPWNKGIPMKDSTKVIQSQRYKGKTWVYDESTQKRIWTTKGD